METEIANQLARLAELLDRQGRVVAGHMQTDDRVLSEVRADLRAIREGQSELRTDFEKHVVKYDAEQAAWRQRLLTPDGTRPVQQTLDRNTLLYIALGASLAGGGLSQAVPQLLQFLAHK